MNPTIYTSISALRSIQRHSGTATSTSRRSRSRSLSFVILLAVVLMTGVVIPAQGKLDFAQIEVARSAKDVVSVTEDLLVASEKRPDLAVGYGKVSQLKLASRKSIYRLGEMISIDVALLNTSDAPAFFHKFLQPNFYVRSQDAQFKPLLPYFLIEALASLDSYILLQPGEMTTESFKLLAGCDKRASGNTTKGIYAMDSRPQLNKNRIGKRGDLCLKVDRLGSYTLIVEQGNNDVVVLGKSNKFKTAVGEARTNMLTITITR